MPNIAFVIERA